MNNIFLALQATQDFNARNTLYAGKSFKPHQFSIPQLCAYLFSNTMLLLSSRNQISNSGFTPEDLAKLEDAAARVIAEKPPQVQQALLAETARFMAAQKGIHAYAPELAEQLSKRVTALTQERLQPAIEQVKWVARESERYEAAPPALG